MEVSMRLTFETWYFVIQNNFIVTVLLLYCKMKYYTLPMWNNIIS